MKRLQCPRLLSRQCLTGAGAEREIYHVCLDFAGRGAPHYRPGDCLGIYPKNRRSLVESILSHLKEGDLQTPVVEGESGREVTLEHFLLHRANLSVCSPSLVCAVEESLPSGTSEKEVLTRLCRQTGQRPMLVQFSRSKTPEALLQRYSKVLRAQDLCDHLRPLLPRLYSIASAPAWEPETIELTVSYVDIAGDPPKLGVCSHWLCRDLKLGDQLSSYHHSNAAFHLPENPETPIVMIGAGTGIAPFRAFLQERLLSGIRGFAWLLAGQRNRRIDFLYRDFLQTLGRGDGLRLDLAFSRDQPEKLYVTDLMRERSKALLDQLEKGAILYVCGSIALGKSTHQALLDILQKEHCQSALQAEGYLRRLRKEGRYRRDVY